MSGSVDEVDVMDHDVEDSKQMGQKSRIDSSKREVQFHPYAVSSANSDISLTHVPYLI
jgi:hypothetical protein